MVQVSLRTLTLLCHSELNLTNLSLEAIRRMALKTGTILKALGSFDGSLVDEEISLESATKVLFIISKAHKIPPETIDNLRKRFLTGTSPSPSPNLTESTESSDRDEMFNLDGKLSIGDSVSQVPHPDYGGWANFFGNETYSDRRLYRVFSNRDWTEALKFLIKSQLTIPELEAIMAFENDFSFATMTRRKAAALIWAQSSPAETFYLQAYNLVQNNTLQALKAGVWSAWQNKRRDLFISMSIGIAHYEILKLASQPLEFIDIVLENDELICRFVREGSRITNAEFKPQNFLEAAPTKRAISSRQPWQKPQPQIPASAILPDDNKLLFDKLKSLATGKGLDSFSGQVALDSHISEEEGKLLAKRCFKAIVAYCKTGSASIYKSKSGLRINFSAGSRR